MEISSVYIPMDRRVALAEGRELPERTRGAALFADISGFTPLTEMLARVLGPKRGAEELTVHLNKVYDSIITVLHRFGGSVISFSGDAITCWFDGQTSDLLPTLRATATALAMQAVMTQFSNIQIVGGEQVSLGMKIAVATGPVRRFIVGDPQYTLVDVMAGKTLENLTNCEHHANKGDIILDSSAVNALGERLQITEWRTDEHTGEKFAVITGLGEDSHSLENPWRLLEPETFTDEQVRTWLIPSVYRLLKAGQADFLAELRPAAALFLCFGGIDYDQDLEAPQKLDIFIRQAQKILARFDGSLLQLTVGDKGSYFYAAFGAPIAHEDDVDRAASAALDLQLLPGQLDFIEPLQIGLTYGRMRVGAYGCASCRTYGVLGDAVNLSARLMQAAKPGQILVNDEVYSRAGAMFVWEELLPIEVKGKTEPVARFRLVRARHRHAGFSLEARFPSLPLGREAVLAELTSNLEKLSSGQGQVIRVSGEAGMGKSHLAAHFIRQAREKNARVVVGICQSVSRSAAYTPWLQIFYQLLNLQDFTESEAIDKLTSAIQVNHPNWELRLPLLGDLLGLPIPDNATTAALDSILRQASLFSLLVEMLQTLAQTQPLVMLIDNAHWMDEVSQALTQTLAQQVCGTFPVMIFLSLRHNRLGEAPQFPNLASLSNNIELVLNEMTSAEVAMVAERTLNAPLSRLLLDIIQPIAHGNPLFMCELLIAMRTGGQISQIENGNWTVSSELLTVLRRANFVIQADGQWQLRGDADLSTVKLGIPDSIHGLVLSRLDRLPEAHKMTLKVSSVIGYTIDLALLIQSHPEKKPRPEVEAEAAFMETEEVIRSEISVEKMYAFLHHTTQEVAYDTLLFTQRQQLHKAVAEALVQYQPGAISSIAYHAYAGEVWPLSMQYNLLAGGQARQLHATQQGIDFFQKALTSAQQLLEADTAKERTQIYMSLGELYVSTGQYTEAGESLQMAVGLAELQGDQESQAQSCRWYGRAYEQQGEYAQALIWLNKGFLALNGITSLEEAELSLLAGLINIRQGNFAKALELCERSLQVGLVLNDIAVQARTYNLLGIIDLRSSGGRANEKFQESLHQYEQIGDVYGQATSHNLIANGYFAKGELSLADLHYRQSLDLFTQIGHVYNQVLVNNNLGGVAIKQGRLDAALGYYQQAVRQLTQIHGSLWVFGALHLNIGNVLIQKFELDAAEAELQRSLAYLDQAKIRDLLPELYGLFAELHLKQNDLAAAERDGQQSIDLAREMAMPREEGHNLRIMGEVALMQLKIGQAEKYLQESFALLAQADDEYESARTQLAIAQLCLVQQKIDEGLSLLDKCASTFERLQANLDLAFVQKVRAGFPNVI